MQAIAKDRDIFSFKAQNDFPYRVLFYDSVLTIGYQH